MKNDEFISILRDRRYKFEMNGDRVRVTHKGSVDLRSLLSLPEGVEFNNKGYVYLRSLLSLPEGVEFNNKGYVDLRSLLSLPEGVEFNNEGSVYLSSLTGKHMYRGKEHTFEFIDGYTMILATKKSHSGLDIYPAKFFCGGAVAKLRRCYVAKSGNLTAHGKSIKEAVDDLMFKVADNSDKSAIAADVVKSGIVTLAQFRGITGACREGVRQYLSSVGIDLSEISEMPLADALSAMKGTSYGETFASHIEATQ